MLDFIESSVERMMGSLPIKDLSFFLCLTAFGRKNKATRFTGGSLFP